MELQPETLRHLQAYIKRKSEERGFADEPAHERLIILVEEVGEIARAFRKRSGMYVNQAAKKEENIGHEIADVINLLFAFATAVDVDVEGAFREKEALVEQRLYARSKSTPK